jgi:hypothetical protein
MRIKREAEKAKKEANNRARKNSHDTNKADKAIAAQVRIDFHLFSFKYTAKICPFSTIPIYVLKIPTFML